MAVIDPIADMLTRVRNAIAVRKRYVFVPYSKLKLEITRVLKAEGFIEHYEVTKDRPQPMIRIRLKYAEGDQPVVSKLQRVSKPGRRVYTKRDSVPLVMSGMGIAIMSTSRGVMTGRRAHQLGLGGEILCYVW